MSDFVVVRNTQAARSPEERWGGSHWSLVNTNRSGAQQKTTQLMTPSEMFHMISHKLLQHVRTHQNFGVKAHKSILTKHQGKIQHISPDGLEKGERIEKTNPSWWIRKRKNIIWREVEGKVHKSFKSKRLRGPEIKRYSTKNCSTHSFTMERAAIRIVRSTVSPALFYNGRHTLLVLPLVLLVELSRLAVGRTVGIWFIKQRLRMRGDKHWKWERFRGKHSNLHRHISQTHTHTHTHVMSSGSLSNNSSVLTFYTRLLWLSEFLFKVQLCECFLLQQKKNASISNSKT